MRSKFRSKPGLQGVGAADPGERVGDLEALDGGLARAEEVAAEDEHRAAALRATVTSGSSLLASPGSWSRSHCARNSLKRVGLNTEESDGVDACACAPGCLPVCSSALVGPLRLVVPAREVLVVVADAQPVLGRRTGSRPWPGRRPGRAAGRSRRAGSARGRGRPAVSGSRAAGGGQGRGPTGLGMRLPLAVVGEEEERLVLLDGTAQRAAELVDAEGRAGRIGRRDLVGVGVRVERLVAEELEGRAVEVVGARLGHHVDHRSARAPVFGGVGVAVDLELLHRVLAELVGSAAGAGAARASGRRTCCCCRRRR